MSTVPISHDWVGETWDWPLQHNDGVVKVLNTKERFEVGLDVQFFRPNEIEVRGRFQKQRCGSILAPRSP